MKEANPKLNSATAGLTYSVTVVIYIIVNLVLSLIVFAANIDEASDGFKYVSYLAAPIALAAGGFAVMNFRKQNISDVVKVKCHFKYYLIALLMIFGLLFAVSDINILTLELLKLIGYTPRGESSYLPSLEGGKVALALLVIALIPAVFEEFLFRGVILNNARQTMGDVRTVFIVGFCFSLFHGSPEQTVYQFICGCAFAFLAVRSNSLLPCVLMHFINNALIIILNACGAFDASGNLAISSGASLAVTIIAAVAFISSILWLLLDKKPILKCQKRGVIFFFLTASVGIFILSIVWVLSFFITG